MYFIGKVISLSLCSAFIIFCFASCKQNITLTTTPQVTITQSASQLPTITQAPTLTPTPTKFIGTIDEEYRNRIEQLDTKDGISIKTALKDLDYTAVGQSEHVKELLISNFLAWFKKSSFPNRETTITRIGNKLLSSYSSSLDELNLILNDLALIAYQGGDPGSVYVLPVIHLIVKSIPHAITVKSKIFFEKYKKIEETQFLLWQRDGPGPSDSQIIESLSYWEGYCRGIKVGDDFWSLPVVNGFPSPWTPKGLLRMLRMKLICDEQFGLPGSYMFRSHDNRLSESHRRLYKKFIVNYPKTETAVILQRYLAAMQKNDWFKNDEARSVLADYELEYSSETDIKVNPIYFSNLD